MRLFLWFLAVWIGVAAVVISLNGYMMLTNQISVFKVVYESLVCGLFISMGAQVIRLILEHS